MKVRNRALSGTSDPNGISMRPPATVSSFESGSDQPTIDVTTRAVGPVHGVAVEFELAEVAVFGRGEAQEPAAQLERLRVQRRTGRRMTS